MSVSNYYSDILYIFRRIYYCVPNKHLNLKNTAKSIFLKKKKGFSESSFDSYFYFKGLGGSNSIYSLFYVDNLEK